MSQQKQHLATTPVPERSHHLITLSARSKQAVRQMALDLDKHLDREPGQKLSNLAYTYHMGRRLHDHRLTITAKSREQLQQLLRQAGHNEWLELETEGPIRYNTRAKRQPKIAFLFSGNGSQYSGMGQELYESSSVFKSVVDECVEILKPCYPRPFLEYLFNPAYRAELNQIHICSTAMFVIEYALAHLWMSWGVYPDYVIGHSLGEYTAACLAGGMLLKDALLLVVERGRLMHEGTENGAMLSMNGTLASVTEYLAAYEGRISIATVNAPEQYVVAGYRDAVEALDKRLEQDGVLHKVLPISIASHSPLMEPVLAEYSAYMANMNFQPLQIPLISNLTGEIVQGRALQGDYWCRHLRDTVQFAAGVETMFAEGVTAFLEIGPHPMLKTLVETMGAGRDNLLLTSLNRKEPNWKTIQEQLGQLWGTGWEIDWEQFDRDYKRKRVHAPSYPFERRSYWIEQEPAVAPAVQTRAPQPVETEYKEEVVEAETVVSAMAGVSTEMLVHKFWSEVLGVDDIQPTDSFMQLGGESLNLIQVQSRLNKALNLNIQLKDLFEHSTFGGLVAFVNTLRKDTPAPVVRKAAVKTAPVVQQAKAQPTAPAALELVAAAEEPAVDTSSYIPRAPEQEHYPVSHTQRRLWFLQQMEPESNAYNSDMSLDLVGELDVFAFRRAYEHLLERHTVLRTVFVEVNGAPCQMIRPVPEIVRGFVYEDLSHMDADKRTAYVREKCMADRNAPFDLSKGSIRLMLLRESANEYHLRLNQHHIITDTWSMELLLKELIESYNAYADGKEPQLPPVPVQYADFAVWHEQELENGRLAQEERFWLNTLRAPLPVLNLPTDFPRPEMQTFNGDLLRISLPAELIGQLRTLAKQQDVSMYMICMTAYMMLLHHLTQDEDLIVGTPVLGRPNESLEGALGFFANSVAIRVKMDGAQTLRDLLTVVKRQSLNAFENQLYPFDLLIEKLNIERDVSRTPIFSTMFAFNTLTLSEEDVKLGNVTLREPKGELAYTTSKFDMTMMVISNASDADDLSVGLEYNTDLFRKSTVLRYAAAFINILRRMATHVHAPLAELDLLTAEDRMAYAALNDTEQRLTSKQPLHQRFEQHVLQQGDALAVSDEQTRLTYAELNERANRIAHHLRQRGIGANQFVGVLIGRNVNMVAAIFGVLKAGAAYVPLDPEYPQDRISYMISDSEAPYVLTEREWADKAQGAAAEVICLEDLPGDLPTHHVNNINRPSDLAYVVYTSGSTGQPKGVPITHQSLENFVLLPEREYGYGAGDILMQVASYSFDASVADTFSALLTGAGLHIISAEKRFSIDSFAAEVAEVGATRVFLPTVFFVQFVNNMTDAHYAQLKTLRTIFVGGEFLPPQAVRTWQQRFGMDILLAQAYGPSETAIYATSYAIMERVREDQVAVPIGKAMPNFDLYVLNARMQPCPINVPGELYIGGAGLAKGYLNKADKTEEAFVPHPFDNRIGAMLYKTGDIVRLLKDGNLEYVSRRDEQVKVRGYRVELGEIEEHLARFPQIRQVAVVAPKGEDGIRRLLAYYSTHSGDEIPAGELRAYLAERLPDYMIPTQIGHLPAMPLSPSGKIDRKSLPAMEGTQQQQVFVAPRNELERRIVEVWTACIRYPNISVYDNFFNIGGDSIVSMQVVARMKQAGLHVKISDLFKHQTIAELAAHIRANGLADAGVSTLSNVPVTGPVPLSHIQRWALENEKMDHEFFFMPLSLEISKPVDPALMQRALKQLLDHHDMLRATYTRTGNGVEQVLLAPEAAEIELQVFDLSAHTDAAEREEEFDRLELELASQVRFEHGLLMRAALFKWSDNSYRLLWLLHHLYNDTVSLRILRQDLIDTYERLEQGLDATLPEQGASYKEWVETCIAFANSEHAETAFDYWGPLLKRIEGHQLLVDHPQGVNRAADIRGLSVQVDEATTTLLRNQVPEQLGTTLKEVILTLAARTLAKWTGEERVVLAINGHGREMLHDEYLLDTTRTVGFFTNIYPFCAEIPEAQTPEETIAQVTERVRTMPHGGTSFGMLRFLSEDASVREQFARYESPSVLLNFHGQFDNLSEVSAWSQGKNGALEQPSDRDSMYNIVLLSYIMDGQLHMHFLYSEHQYEESSMVRLKQLFEQEVQLVTSAVQTQN